MKIALREWTEADIADVIRLTNDPEIPRWTRVPEPNTIETVSAWFASRPDDEWHLAVVDAERGEVVGSVALIRGDRDNGRAEIGYWVAAEHRGMGAASTAVAMVAERAFAAGWHRLELHIDPDNAASRRVAEKAGFALEGVLRDYELIKDRRADVAMYARIASPRNG